MTRRHTDALGDIAVHESSLIYHLRCLREDATDPDLTSLERLALVRDRVARVREIRRELEAVNVMDAERRGDQPR
jgi:hypothetical protein